MTKLSEIKVNLSPNHNDVFKKRETIILRLAKTLCLEMTFYTFHRIL